MLLDYSWPGNVRELENAIERAVVLTRTDVITAADLMLESVGGSLSAPHQGDVGATATQPAAGDPRANGRDHVAATPQEARDVSLTEYLDKAASQRIAQALAKAKGNRAEAARNLGIGRATLYRFMRRLGNESSFARREDEQR